jgi:hypothetical protein
MPRATEAEKRAQAKYQKKPEQVAKRVARNKARRHMIKAGKVRKGDGKDINHKDGNALNNSRSNWQVQSRKANRSFPRTKSAGKRNPRD